MKFKFLLAFCLLIGLLSAIEFKIIPPDTIYFKYLEHTPTIDGTYTSSYEECDSRTFDDLTIRSCYYNQKLYFYFHIDDPLYKGADYFYLGFDTNKDNAISKGEPRIIIYRNGSVTNPENWIFVKKNAPTKSGGWQGEILVPFEDVGLPTSLGSGKSKNGPNMRIKAEGATEGTLGEFYGSTVGKTYSNYYWSEPKAFGVYQPCAGNPEQNWTRETDNKTIKVLEFSIGSNNEEPFTLTQFVFQGTGTGDEETDIEQAELYMWMNGTKELIGTRTFTHDNGNIAIASIIHINGEHLGSAAPIFELYYVMDDNAGSKGGLSSSFIAKLTSVSNIGVYTNEELEVNSLPFKGGSLFTFDCATDSGCDDDEFCGNGICVDVIPGVCGYAGNHQWINYECCDDSDCSSGYVCSSHACEEESTAPPPSSENETEPPETIITTPNATESTSNATVTANVTANETAHPQNATTQSNETTAPDITATNATLPGNATVTAPGKEGGIWIDNNTIISAVVVLIILGGAYYYLKMRKVEG
jgi:hypothetical protein